MCRARKQTKANRAGRIVAAMLLIPAIIIGRLTVEYSTPLFWVAVSIAIWSEYKLGWMN